MTSAARRSEPTRPRIPRRVPELEARLVAEKDPVWMAFLNAPISEEPDTEEELEAVERALGSGRSEPHAVVAAKVAARQR